MTARFPPGRAIVPAAPVLEGEIYGPHQQTPADLNRPKPPFRPIYDHPTDWEILYRGDVTG